jgi:hypothetical protein
MNLKTWAKTWSKTDLALKKVRAEELKNFNYSKHLDLLNGMLEWACKNAKILKTSGLVEQQKLFSKLRAK